MSDIMEENQLQTAPEPLPEQAICETTVRIDKELIGRTARTLRMILWVMLVVGAVGLVAWIATSVTLETLFEQGIYTGNYELADRLLDIVLWISAVLFACGLIFTLSLRANAKKDVKGDRANVYRFYERYFTITDLREGENLGTVKTYYADLAKVREDKEFFLLYPNSATFFPVDKKKLSGEEIGALRKVLPLKKKK